jgi:hypothetical protein
MLLVPIFIPPSESDDPPRTDRPGIVALLVTILIAVVIVFGLTLRTGPALWPIMAVSLGVLLVLGLGIMLGAARRPGARAQSQAEKRKRGLDGLDRYALIDGLVEGLDDDELAYLRRRIEDREAGERPLPEAMEALLKRSKDRSAGRD